MTRSGRTAGDGPGQGRWPWTAAGEILRAHTPADDEGTIKTVEITASISIPTDYRATIQFVDQAGLTAFGSSAGSADRSSEIYLVRPERARTQFVLALDELFNDETVAKDEVLEDGSRRKNITLVGCSIQRGDNALIPINGVFIGYRLVIDERTILVHAPIVSLILSPTGEGTDLLIYEDTLKRYQIDPETGEVSPR